MTDTSAAAPDIAALLQDFSTKLDRISQENADLRSELARQRASVPRTRPMQKVDLHNATKRREQVRSALGRGDVPAMATGHGAADQIPVDFQGHKIPKNLLAAMGAAFGVGDEVRINPDVTREGWTADQTWRAVLDKARVDGFGVVDRVLWYAKGGYWKYKVHVPGLTGRSPDGFYEYELLPA